MIVPPINTKGVFTFHEPYSSLLNADTKELTVIAIRLIQDLVQSEEEPFATIYQASGLTAEDYKNDLRDNVPIITFQSGEGKLAYVPAKYIAKFPNNTGRLYQEYFLAAYLPMMEYGKDLTLLRDEVSEIISDLIGVRCKVVTAPASDVIIIPEEEHMQIQADLKRTMAYTKSIRHRFKLLENEYEKLREENEKLKEALIKVPKEIRYI